MAIHGELSLDDLRRMTWQAHCRESIRELVASYGMAVDDRDMEALSGCFARAGVFQYADGSLRLEGRDAVLDYYRQRLGLLGASYHYPHSHLITFDGDDRAHGVVNAHAELGLPTGDTGWVALRYYDRYVLEDGDWRFEERTIHFLYYLKLEELPKALASPLRKRMVSPAQVADLPEQLESWKQFKASLAQQ
ncbi:MAG: nuclear transport factor 2 family protein [Steroidobacteraceae bacterium]|jgi:hypothetical protein|nr:nuclear transport factor 2 family protein [Steroidobacteraceae bacterium]